MGVLGSKRAKNDLKVPISVCFALYLRICRSYHQDFDNDVYRCFSLYFFIKWNIANIKIILFLLAHFNSFLNNSLFFKFINKCQKEILVCAPPSSHVCDFYFFVFLSLLMSQSVWHIDPVGLIEIHLKFLKTCCCEAPSDFWVKKW